MTERINLNSARVLVIDDSEPFTEVITTILRAFGVADLMSCRSVPEGQAICRGEAFDLILCDGEMPDVDGYEFVKWLRRDAEGPNSATAVLMMTAHSTFAKVTSARDAGANFMIAKPIEPRILLERIRWISADTRPFIRVETYVGPDRRFKSKFPNPERRKGDVSAMTAEEGARELSQSGIDELFA